MLIIKWLKDFFWNFFIVSTISFYINNILCQDIPLSLPSIYTLWHLSFWVSFTSACTYWSINLKYLKLFITPKIKFQFINEKITISSISCVTIHFLELNFLLLNIRRLWLTTVNVSSCFKCRKDLNNLCIKQNRNTHNLRCKCLAIKGFTVRTHKIVTGIQ